MLTLLTPFNQRKTQTHICFDDLPLLVMNFHLKHRMIKFCHCKTGVKNKKNEHCKINPLGSMGIGQAAAAAAAVETCDSCPRFSHTTACTHFAKINHFWKHFILCSLISPAPLLSAGVGCQHKPACDCRTNANNVGI